MSDQSQTVSNGGFVGRPVSTPRNDFETAAMYVFAAITASWQQLFMAVAWPVSLLCYARPSREVAG